MPPKSVVVCAVSGGADSMAMLHGLHEVGQVRKRGWRLHVAHLDHGLADNAAVMRRFVQGTAAALDLDCTIEHADVAAAAAAAGESIEEAGRNLRYAFLERVARDAGAACVALAHHADDQAETVLHRILRGTGLRGLAGMPKRRPIREASDVEIVRPLLSFRREDCRAYLKQRGLGFVHDASNDNVHAATRNRIRHDLLPRIEQTINPQVVTALNRLSEQAGRAVTPGPAPVSLILELLRLDAGAGEFSLDASRFARLPRALQTEVVLHVLRELGVGLKHVGFERLEAVVDAAAGDGRARWLELTGAQVERRGRVVRFIARSPNGVVEPGRRVPVEGPPT